MIRHARPALGGRECSLALRTASLAARCSVACLRWVLGPGVCVCPVLVCDPDSYSVLAVEAAVAAEDTRGAFLSDDAR